MACSCPPRVLHRGRCSTVFLADAYGCRAASGGCHGPCRDEEDCPAHVGPGLDPASQSACGHCGERASVVIKVYHKSSMQRRHHLNVSREVALLMRLRAMGVPGVVRLLGTSECASNVYLTFAACERGDLHARIRDGSCRARGEGAVCREVRV